MRGRAVIGLLLVAALLATAAMQTAARVQRRRLIPPPQTTSRLSGLDSFSLGLVLGGLRGPLVMILWPSVENQKAARNLEDIDTKIELIRLLQAEFDQVHLFQMWNKAWNISVQMATLQNKYAIILDAIDYGHRVLQERPDNVNVLSETGRIYFDKFGTADEARYYAERVRRDSMHRSLPSRPPQRRTRHDVLLDERGFILDRYLAPRPGMPPGRGTVTDYVNNGAELQFLQRYSNAEAGGFPYGVSPFALSYNYYKRAQVIISTTGQTPIQLSENVISSRTGVALKGWMSEELTIARRREIEALGQRPPYERRAMEAVTASVPPGAGFPDASRQTQDRIREALFSYGRAVLVGDDAVAEYTRHLANPEWALTADTYYRDRDHVRAMIALAAADREYLQAMAAASAGAAREEVAGHLAAAASHYEQAINRNYLVILKYFTDADLAAEIYPRITQERLGRSFQRSNIQEADPAIYPVLRAAIREAFRQANRIDEAQYDIEEYEGYIERARARLGQLRQYAAAGSKPDA